MRLQLRINYPVDNRRTRNALELVVPRLGVDFEDVFYNCTDCVTTRLIAEIQYEASADEKALSFGNLLEFLAKTRFAYTGLAAQQHNLADFIFFAAAQD